MFVNFNILNQLGSPAINSNTFANRPAAGQTGRLFVSTDTFEIYRDNGTTWDLIGGPGSSTITGSGTTGKLAKFTSSNSIGDSAITETLTELQTSYQITTSNFIVTSQEVVVQKNSTATGTSFLGLKNASAVNRWNIGLDVLETGVGNTGSNFNLWRYDDSGGTLSKAISIERSSGNVTLSNNITASSIIKAGGLSTQYLMADGSTSTLTNPVTGTGAATQVAFWNSSSNITGSNNLFWNDTSGRLGINTATPGTSLDVHGTGTIQQLNTTGATANNYLAFQRTGTTTFSIGDTYNGGSNYFRIFGNSLSADIVRIFAATGESFFTSTETYSTGNSVAISAQNNLTLPNGTTVGVATLTGINSNLNLTIQGNATIQNTGRQGLEGSSTISFSSAGTLTINQGASTVRAFSAMGSVYAFNGSAVGTITHLAGLRICFPDNVGSAVNITNNYALLINDQTTGLGTVTYTNRWGIYQEGASDLNYFNGNLLLGSVTNSGQRLQVTGTALFTGSVTGTGNSSTYTVTATGGFARSKSITSTLTAAANNDSLIGLDISPTYTTGAFTGVSSIALRTVTGNVLLNSTSGITTIGGTSANATFRLNVLGSSGSHRIYSLNTGTSSTDISVLQAEVASATSGAAFVFTGRTGSGWSFGVIPSSNTFVIRRNFDLVLDAQALVTILSTNDSVGLATTTPGSRLQVNGGAAIGYSASTAAPTNGLQVAGATNLNGLVTLGDAINIAVNTTTGTKIGTATSQKLSFWNATPIVQPTTAVAGAARVGGGGATVTDTDTFGGYTIAQVVQALRNTGILA